jgi:hypothetical protein
LWVQWGLTSLLPRFSSYPSARCVSVSPHRNRLLFPCRLRRFPMYVSVEVIWPTLSHRLFTTPICFLIAFNLYAHYYFVCTVSPGFVEDPPREIGTGFFWSVQKQEDKPGRSLRSSGVKWSELLNITPASASKCRKCGQKRPEVCSCNFQEPAPN